MLNISEFLKNKEAETSRVALIEILNRYTQPAFGSLPKREADILIFDVMRDLGLLREDASVYDLMTDLRITRAKASQLLFDTAIRRFDENPALLDAKVLHALCNARFHQDTDKYFLLEVEDPMVNAYLKEKIRRAGFISDSSFNSALIRLPLDAVADLITDLVPDPQQGAVKAALIRAGAPEELSFKSVLKSSLKALGKRALGDAADGLVDSAGEFLAPILREGLDVTKKWLPIFDKAGEDHNGVLV